MPVFEVGYLWVRGGGRGHRVTAAALDVACPQSVEAAVLLPEEPAPDLGVTSPGLHFLTAGDQGTWAGAGRGRAWGRPTAESPSRLCPGAGALRVWEAASGQCVHTQPRWPGPGRELSHCSLAPAAGLLLTVTTDHNLLLYDVRSLQLRKQVSALSQPWGLGGRLVLH